MIYGICMEPLQQLARVSLKVMNYLSRIERQGMRLVDFYIV